MDNHGSWITRQQLAEALRRLCAEGRTGTLYCSTDDNRSVAVTLNEGKIVTLSARGAQGLAALSEIHAIQKVRITFEDMRGLGSVLTASPGLPSTHEILQAVAGTPLSKVEASTLPIRLSQLRQAAEDEASNLFGPVARLLCAEEFARAGQLGDVDDVKRLLSAIARATGETALVEKFIAGVMKKAGLGQGRGPRAG